MSRSKNSKNFRRSRQSSISSTNSTPSKNQARSTHVSDIVVDSASDPVKRYMTSNNRPNVTKTYKPQYKRTKAGSSQSNATEVITKPVEEPFKKDRIPKTRGGEERESDGRNRVISAKLPNITNKNIDEYPRDVNNEQSEHKENEEEDYLPVESSNEIVDISKSVRDEISDNGSDDENEKKSSGSETEQIYLDEGNSDDERRSENNMENMDFG
ncbi:12715_t:CDS:2, partial [Acaulospora morrowiae]